MYKGFFSDSLDGSESSYHISSVGEENASGGEPSIRSVPNVDERKFYPRSKTIMPAVPKSLLKHNNITLLKGGSGEDSLSFRSKCDSSSVGSFASQLNCQDRTGAPKPIINALDAENKFKINCYNAFKKFTSKSGGVNEINHGVYGHQLKTAMKQISTQIPSHDIKNLMKKLAVDHMDILCWKDFEMFAYTLFIPYFENKPINLLVGERSMSTVNSSSGQSNAFQALMRKQRAASAANSAPQQYGSVVNSSVRTGSANSSPDSRRQGPSGKVRSTPLTSYSPEANKSVVFREGLVLGENLDGLLVPTFEIKEALVDVVKFNERYARKQHHKGEDLMITKKPSRARSEGDEGPSVDIIASPVVSHAGSDAPGSVSGELSRSSPFGSQPGSPLPASGRNSVNSFRMSPSPPGSMDPSSRGPSPLNMPLETQKSARLQKLKPPALVKQNSDANLTLKELEYKKFHHRLPTVKMKLNEINNKPAAYSTKWLNMKKIRDSQNAAIDRRAYLKTLKRDMTSFTIASEKEIVVDRLNEQRAGAGSIIGLKIAERKHLAKTTAENVARWREEETERKKATAAELSKALFASSTMSRSMLFEEQADRNTYKEGSIGRLSSYSSTQVDIPDSFEKAIQNAKSQKQWDAAQLAKKKYREQILSDRIYDYTMAKSAAVLRNVRPMSSTQQGLGEPGTPGRSMEFFTQTRQTDEDLISFNIEYAKYLGDSYSLPSLRPQTAGEEDDESIESNVADGAYRPVDSEELAEGAFPADERSPLQQASQFFKSSEV